MNQHFSKIPKLDGVKKAKEALKKFRNQKPSEKLIKIISEYDHVEKSGIAQKKSASSFLNKIYLFLLFIFQLYSPTSFAKNVQLKYDPSTVALTGTIEMQTFSGLPNYESIASGDKAEKNFYLRLDHSIDVIGDKNNPGNNAETEKNVRIVQLAIGDDEAWEQVVKAGAGAHVSLKGHLYHRFNGHHHSRVLMSVVGKN